MARHYAVGSLTGRDLRHIRLGLLMTQLELAQVLGYKHKIRISEFERHRNPVPIPLHIQRAVIHIWDTGGYGLHGRAPAVREWERRVPFPK